MGKGKRKVPGLNQSSTADISFILLIFFLVTTSMDTDTGLPRRLPEWDPNVEEQEWVGDYLIFEELLLNKLYLIICMENMRQL